MTIREQISAILDEELMAEEQTFCGLPACPTITGKDVVVERLLKLLQQQSVSNSPHLFEIREVLKEETKDMED